MQKITIITQKNCDPCQSLKAELDKRDIAFEVLEWERGSENTEVKRLLGAAQYPVSGLSTPTAVIEDENGKLKVLDNGATGILQTIETYSFDIYKTQPLVTDTRTGSEMPKKQTETLPTTWLGVPPKCYGYGAVTLLLVVGLVYLYNQYKPLL
jgi:glutaredoxin